MCKVMCILCFIPCVSGYDAKCVDFKRDDRACPNKGETYI